MDFAATSTRLGKVLFFRKLKLFSLGSDPNVLRGVQNFEKVLYLPVNYIVGIRLTNCKCTAVPYKVKS
jgi:hypothetical protein